MSQITGGELLARCLANEGVRFVFGLPCPEQDPLLASLDGNGIRLVPVRHESAAGLAPIVFYIIGIAHIIALVACILLGG